MTKDHIMETVSTYEEVKMINVSAERTHLHLAKGYACVELENPDEAEKALTTGNRGQTDGQEVTASAVQPLV